MRLKELKNIISEEYKLFLEAEEDTADDKEKKKMINLKEVTTNLKVTINQRKNLQ